MKTKRLKKLMMGMGLSRNQVNYMVRAQRTEGALDVSNELYYFHAKRIIQGLESELLPFLRSFVLGNAEDDADDINKNEPAHATNTDEPKG